MTLLEMNSDVEKVYYASSGKKKAKEGVTIAENPPLKNIKQYVKTRILNAMDVEK